MNAIKTFFDAVDLIASRMPGLDRLVVEVIIIGLAIFGGYTLFKHHP